MKKCLVWCCKNFQGKTQNISYFRLTKQRHDSWLRALGRDPVDRMSYANVICSEHFVDSDFVVPGTSKLSPKAVPSIHLSPPNYDGVETIKTEMSLKDPLSITENDLLIRISEEYSLPSRSSSASNEWNMEVTDTCNHVQQEIEFKPLPLFENELEPELPSTADCKEPHEIDHTYSLPIERLAEQVEMVKDDNIRLRNTIVSLQHKALSLSRKVNAMKDIIKHHRRMRRRNKRKS